MHIDPAWLTIAVPVVGFQIGIIVQLTQIKTMVADLRTGARDIDKQQAELQTKQQETATAVARLDVRVEALESRTFKHPRTAP